MIRAAEILAEYRRRRYTIRGDGTVLNQEGRVIDRVPHDLLSHEERTQHEKQNEEDQKEVDRKKAASGDDT